MTDPRLKAAILTVSDKGSIGQRTDTSGPALKEMLASIGAEAAAYEIVPDERPLIAGKLKHYADDLGCDLVLTTGGTGFSPRDVTPEATLDVLDRLAPGISEAIRAKSMQITPKAMLSRAVAGIRKKTLIINLPGSEKGARESLEAVLPALVHGIEILRGDAGECGRN
jgi:molybdenum cofactor synthesis domain-containing protein